MSNFPREPVQKEPRHGARPGILTSMAGGPETAKAGVLSLKDDRAKVPGLMEIELWPDGRPSRPMGMGGVITTLEKIRPPALPLELPERSDIVFQ